MAKKTGNFVRKGLAVGDMLRGIKRFFNPDVPQPPDAPDPAPVADDASMSIANERLMARRRKGGRGSTILSESGKLG